MVQHRLWPRVFITPVVPPGFIPPATVLLHHGIHRQAKWICPALRNQRHKLSQIRRPRFTRPAAVHALTADLPDLLFSHRANLSNPELRRRSPVLLGPAVRIHLPISSHSFQAVSVADKSVFTFPLFTCCPNFLNCP